MIPRAFDMRELSIESRIKIEEKELEELKPVSKEELQKEFDRGYQAGLDKMTREYESLLRDYKLLRKRLNPLTYHD